MLQNTSDWRTDRVETNVNNRYVIVLHQLTINSSNNINTKININVNIDVSDMAKADW